MEKENMRNYDENQTNNDLIILGKNNLITALFTDPSMIRTIYESLLSKGYKQEDLNLIMSEDTRNSYFPKFESTTSSADIGNKSLEGLGIGAALGGSTAAIAAAIAAIGTALVIPGLGLVIAGPLAASFAGAGAGAAVGGIVGALIGSSLPDEQAEMFEEAINEGGFVISIKANSDSDRNELHKLLSNFKKSNSPTRAA